MTTTDNSSSTSNRRSKGLTNNKLETLIKASTSLSKSFRSEGMSSSKLSLRSIFKRKTKF